MTPRVVPWNVNTERPNTYFPNINRTFTTDLTYLPGTAQRKRFHPNVKNRESSWSPYEPKKINFFRNTKELPLQEAGNEEAEAGREMEPLTLGMEPPTFSAEEPTLADAIRHPEIQILKPLGLLRREYKHPLSMYEDVLSSSLYSRYLNSRPKSWNPTLPTHYSRDSQPPFSPVVYLERPNTAGKAWVTNRWRMWAGGSPSSPRF